MKYRRFGKTNLELSVFSLGTMRCITDVEIFHHTIEKALEWGINHLETARGYGKSEEYLGTAIKTGLSVPRGQFYITTKIPPCADNSTMERHIDESLQKLNVDYLDALGIHGLNTEQHWQWVKSNNGCMKAIQRAIDDGRIKHVGFSTHGSLKIILDAINTDYFEFVNLHYYYFFQRNNLAVAAAKEKDMGVFIISPADKGGRLYTPSDKLKELCQPFTPLELNYRFLLSDSRITTLSVGAANPEELTVPLAVSDNISNLTPAEVKVFKNLENYQTQILGTDKCSQCYDCLPCPENINIPEILRLRNLTVAYNMIDYGKYRYGMLENAGHWFPGMKGNRCTDCGDCLPKCPENLDIPHLLQNAHETLNGKASRRLWD
ncbi:aldo/keto reductase [Cylindrospermopsis curvispora]|uniref:Aldo/keto reductase n=1 Tax=Cylindrospermopsis curvispora GIHE-G1 TaxID=2666332 RepID=A0A7H0F4A8_9CYAN|nr:aldo/keto reductase [Cylindrospermopsis curvispora]QNP30874.1 aldo/keto reductase [Cylindrospermopsis curvispora GIHE-G1]